MFPWSSTENRYVRFQPGIILIYLNMICWAVIYDFSLGTFQIPKPWTNLHSWLLASFLVVNIIIIIKYMQPQPPPKKRLKNHTFFFLCGKTARLFSVVQHSILSRTAYTNIPKRINNLPRFEKEKNQVGNIKRSFVQTSRKLDPVVICWVSSLSSAPA